MGNETQMMVRVVIVQSSFASDEVRRELCDAGFVWNRDFVVLSKGSRALDYIVPNSRQLLVAGTISSDPVPVVLMVEEAKRKNGQVESWYFSVLTHKKPPLFDRYVKKGLNGKYCTNLIVSLREWLKVEPS